jgi:C-terminal processing protease CtpA/Prc
MYTFEQYIEPNTQKWQYTGKIVVLINAKAMSQAEHTCLLLEAAANATFVGSPTNGTDGTVTSMVLPGGIEVKFTQQDVRHADGRQLQRVGIQPHVFASPTIAGIRAGRDEVLDKGIEVLQGLLNKQEQTTIPTKTPKRSKK